MPSKYANIQLTDTFNTWRVQYNQIQKNINDILGANGVIDFYANTVTAKHQVNTPRAFANTLTVRANTMISGHANFQNAATIKIGNVRRVTVSQANTNDYLTVDATGNVYPRPLPSFTPVTGTNGNSIPRLGTVNTWNKKQKFINSISVVLTDNFATPGPDFDMYRVTGSPAVNDVLARVRWIGRDSAAANTTYATQFATIVNPTNTSEESALTTQVMIAGTLTNHSVANSLGYHLLQGNYYLGSSQVTPETIVETQSSLSGANATFDVTAVPAGTKSVEFEMYGIQPDTNSKELRVRMKIGGVWFAGSSDYEYISMNAGSTYGPGRTATFTTDSIRLTGTGSGQEPGSDPEEYYDGRLWLLDPLNTTRPKKITWHHSADVSTSSGLEIRTGTGRCKGTNSNGAIQAIDFHWESGANFAAGEIIMRAKA